MAKFTQLARSLRRNQTDVERRLWSRLRRRGLCGWKFYRQLPIDRFIADFVCKEARLIVELDGDQHGRSLQADEHRTRVLEAQGYQVIRFWNGEINQNLDGVLETILVHLEKPE